MRIGFRRIICGSLVLFSSVSIRADEGMWLYNALPVDEIRRAYGVDVTPEMADHMMKASVRFNNGGSGSFVSSKGLVLTNHHVALAGLAKISTEARNIAEHGYHAKSSGEEIQIPGFELNQLVAIEDVTARVQASVQLGMSVEAAHAARRAAIAQIEKENKEQTGLRSDVVTLFLGGQYHLYTYRQFTDVRLVFAPEASIAFFGGDPDNFEFPRYDLDMTLFRVYEDGQPAQIHNYFRWSFDGPKAGDPVFVSGHPGKTNRLFTVAAMTDLRDRQLPHGLAALQKERDALEAYAVLDPENARRAQKEIFGIDNNLKRNRGWLDAFAQPGYLEARQTSEDELRAWVAQNDALKKSNPDLQKAWEVIQTAQVTKARLSDTYSRLEGASILKSRYFALARVLVRLAEEEKKPDGKRLPEYQQSARRSLELSLYSTEPIYPDFEQVKLEASLQTLVDDPTADAYVRAQVLQGKTPKLRAQELIRNTQLGDVAVRTALATGGKSGIATSRDSMIQLAAAIDVESRRIREEYEAEVVEVEKQAYAQIARAMFERYGVSMYPDATFTLRLSYGSVRGYEASPGVDGVPPMTYLGGAFDHELVHGARVPWELPSSWHRARGAFDEQATFNFVSTNDIIGGNSGSPVISKCGRELVGLVFDGNAHSLGAANAYQGITGRAVSVSSQGMAEVLRNIYGADEIIRELGR